MKMVKWLGLVIIAVMLIAPLVYAEEELGRDEACKLLGNCGDEMVSTAEKMRAQCQDMIALAQKLKLKGGKLKQRGMVWGDQAMIAEGAGLIEQGQKMEDEARKMDEACKIIIEEGKKKKRSAGKMQTEGADQYHNPSGDHTPH